MEWLNYLIENKEQIGVVALAIFGVTSALARLIPSKKYENLNTALGKLLFVIFQGTKLK